MPLAIWFAFIAATDGMDLAALLAKKADLPFGSYMLAFQLWLRKARSDQPQQLKPWSSRFWSCDLAARENVRLMRTTKIYLFEMILSCHTMHHPTWNCPMNLDPKVTAESTPWSGLTSGAGASSPRLRL
jgi:hypothetical protein